MSNSSLPLDGQAAIVVNAMNDDEGATAVVAEIEAAGGKAIKHMADVTGQTLHVNGGRYLP